MTFTPTDTANYTPATTTVAIDVAKATPVITWPTPAGIVYGTALSATQLNATTPRVAGTFAYTPAAGDGAQRRRAQTLSVTFTPTDAANYTAGDDDGHDRRRQGDAGDHLADARRHHLRHGAQRDAAERDEPAVRGHLRLYARSPATVLNAGARRRCR